MIALKTRLTSIGLKPTAPVDDAGVHTRIDKDVWKLHCALSTCNNMYKGHTKVCAKGALPSQVASLH